MSDGMLAVGHRCKFNDPDGDAAFCVSDNIRHWEHCDVVRVLSFEIVENQRIPVCWNERTQTASAVAYSYLTTPELH